MDLPKSADDLQTMSVKYISSKEAAVICNYTIDHIGRLCRSGKLQSKRIGRDWFVSEASILEYQKKAGIFSEAQLISDNSWDESLFANLEIPEKPNLDVGRLSKFGRSMSFHFITKLLAAAVLVTAIFLSYDSNKIKNFSLSQAENNSANVFDSVKSFFLKNIPSALSFLENSFSNLLVRKPAPVITKNIPPVNPPPQTPPSKGGETDITISPPAPYGGAGQGGEVSPGIINKILIRLASLENKIEGNKLTQNELDKINTGILIAHPCGPGYPLFTDSYRYRHNPCPHTFSGVALLSLVL